MSTEVDRYADLDDGSGRTQLLILPRFKALANFITTETLCPSVSDIFAEYITINVVVEA